jgi:hypothetical protein
MAGFKEVFEIGKVVSFLKEVLDLQKLELGWSSSWIKVLT